MTDKFRRVKLPLKLFSVQAWRRTQVYFLALFAVYLTLSVGTAVTEGWNLFEGFYFGAVSLTTVGYGELAPTQTASRILFILLVPAGIVLVFGIGIVVLAEGFRGLLSRRELKMIRPGLKDHYIVCGFGNIGQVVVRQLLKANRRVCVVDQDAGSVKYLEEAGVDYVIGNAMDSSVLEEAKLDTAAGVLTTFESDVNNIYVILEGRDSKARLPIIATASNADVARRMRLAGARRVISPQALAGEMLANTMVNPDTIDFLNEVANVGGSGASLGQVAVQEGSWVDGLTLRETGSRLTGVRVLLAREGGKVNFAPAGDMLLKPGMVLVVVGEAEGIRAFSDMKPPRHGTMTGIFPIGGNELSPP